MKRLWMGLLALALVCALTGCGTQAAREPFVAPYEMNEDQEELFSLLGEIADGTMVFSFQGPEDATQLSAHSYVLEDGAWVENGGVSLARDAQDKTPFRGEFTLIHKKNRSMLFYLFGQGTIAASSEPVAFAGELTASSYGGLSESQPVTLGEEIPVAVFVEDSGNAMKSLGPEVYFTPEEAADYDIVQVVTLEFTTE